VQRSAVTPLMSIGARSRAHGATGSVAPSPVAAVLAKARARGKGSRKKRAVRGGPGRSRYHTPRCAFARKVLLKREEVEAAVGGMPSTYPYNNVIQANRRRAVFGAKHRGSVLARSGGRVWEAPVAGAGRPRCAARRRRY